MSRAVSAEKFENSGAVSDGWPEQLAVRVARCYYDLGMTQQEIADFVGIGRAKVIKLLSEARERGIVSIRINSPLMENLELADALRDKYQLRAVDVCLSHASDELQLAEQVGAAAGEVVLRHIDNGMTVGLGWGVTLKEMVRQVEHSPRRDVSVVSLLGSLTRRSSVAKFEATTQLASRLDAECLYLPAPIVCDSSDTRRLLEGQPLFKDIHQRALKADLAIVSIGGLDSATIREVGLVTASEYASVRKCGAIGNFLGFYIDDQAKLVDHPINQRIIGIRGEVFKKIPQRIMISAGAKKADALKAVLLQGFVTDLITDQLTANALLA